MRTYTVQYQQSLLDVALQECGDVLAIIDIALLNNIGITEDLEAGQVLLLPEATKPEVVKYYRDRKITLATDIPRPNKPQTIFFPPIPQPWLIGNVYNLEAIATSGLPVSYTSSNTGVATIVGNTLTIVGAGSATITALQNGNEVYYPAVPVSQNLEIDDIYYGFPASFRNAIAFRFNAKDTPNFVLREDAGDFFVVSYTDPISGITVSQATASEQPKKIANECIFDGTNDVLFNNSAFITNQIKSAVAVANCNLATFNSFDCIVTTRYYVVNVFQLYIGGIPTTTNLFNSDTNVATNVHINNVSGNNFSPMGNLKSVYVEANASGTFLFIGADTDVRYWSGEINDVILFNRVLTSTERAELQTYLESFHGFTP